MSQSNRKYRAIISGGGTGGHIYPAIAIANALKDIHPDMEILFVGALGRMEMEKVPKAGYEIIGLPVSGIQRSFSLSAIWKNLQFPFKLMKSMSMAKKIVKDFKPDVAIGVGGYASGPLLRAATGLGVPGLIQEQNSFAGKTNKWLSKRVKKICVAYSGMEKYFPADKIIFTGNPVRKDILQIDTKREEALKHFGLSAKKKTILSVGGSLGARTLNHTLSDGLSRIEDAGVQLLWQTGKWYKEEGLEAVKGKEDKGIYAHEFIYEMDLAYAAADVVISRAGALSISELCLVHKPAILVPSPNVAEDHQTMNAMSLVQENAAIMVKDVEAKDKLVDEVLALIKNEEKQKELSANIVKMGKPYAAKEIAEHALSIIKR